MKKSKFVTIGLVALSIAACNDRDSSQYPNYAQYQNNPNYYLRTDSNGHYCGGYSVHPIWIFHSYSYSGGYVRSEPVAAFKGSARSSSFSTSSGGHVSHGSVSRGGFGRSASVSS